MLLLPVIVQLLNKRGRLSLLCLYTCRQYGMHGTPATQCTAKVILLWRFSCFMLLCPCLQAVSPLPVQQSAAERARLEQLAMRQSKQLIPMLPASSKDKAKGKHLPAGGSKGPVQAAPEGLGRTRSLPSTKKGEEPISGPVMMGLGQLQQPRRGPVPAERQQQAAGARDNGAGELEVM